MLMALTHHCPGMSHGLLYDLFSDSLFCHWPAVTPAYPFEVVDASRYCAMFSKCLMSTIFVYCFTVSTF